MQFSKNDEQQKTGNKTKHFCFWKNNEKIILFIFCAV